MAEVEKRLAEEMAKVKALMALLKQHGISLPTELQTIMEEESKTMLEEVRPRDSKLGWLSDRPRIESTVAIQLLRRPTDMLARGTLSLFQAVKNMVNDFPEVTIQFTGLSVYSIVHSNEDEMPTMFRAVRNLFVRPFKVEKLQRRTILKDLTGSFSPRKMTLVVGPPGSGKSVFMKALSGRLHLSKTLREEGSLTYNGFTATSGAFVLPKVVEYIDQNDEHAPTLTVRETLQFLWYNATGGTHAYGADPLKAEKLRELDAQEGKIEVILRLYGLKRVADTIVGNELLRGVSGGERRRVTTAEMVCAVSQAGIFDSISTGLDSASTFDIVRTAQEATRQLNRTTVISLLQPPPEVFSLFDDVLILVKGQIIYHGPRAEVLEYFAEMGFECPPVVDTADFLQEVALPEGRKYLREDVVDCPRTVDEFAAHFKNSTIFKEMAKGISHTPPKGYEWRYYQKEKYASSWYFHMRLCLWRQWLLTIRDVTFLKAKAGQTIILGLLIGSLFFGLKKTDVQSTYGLLQFSALFLALGSMPQLMIAFASRPVLYKHSDASLYPTSCHVVAQMLVQIPVSVLEILVFSIIVYFMTGLTLSDGGSHFWLFLLIIFDFQLVMSQLFRTICAVVPSVQAGQPVSGMLILLFLLFCGFMVNKNDLPKGWLWMYYINPLTWCLQSLAVNQYTSSEFQHTYITVDGVKESLGDVYLDFFAYEKDSKYIWWGILVMFAEFLALMGLCSLGYAVLRFDPAHAGTHSEVDDDVLSEKDDFKAEGLGLPFDPATLAFQDLWYTVDSSVPGEKIDLLKGVSGFCRPGTMTALMGSSGAGKTTLLDVLAGRKTGGEINGMIAVNGVKKDDVKFRQMMGYVEQLDTHSPHTTVREALEFSARLRLPMSVTDEARIKFVNDVVHMLELEDICDSLVGSREEGGLSFEQRKRLTIGVELVANPAILFLDEPTSGLDARAAQVVMRSITRVAKTGRSVICTIHQPSKALFEMFDSLLLLKRGGQVVYFGPLGQNSINLVEYFEALAPEHQMKAGANPATWMLDIIGAGVSSAGPSRAYEADYVSSPLYAANLETLITLVPAVSEEEEDLLKPVKRRQSVQATSYQVSWSIQFDACMNRAVKAYWRSPNYNLVRIVLGIVVALIFGSVFASNTSYTTDTQLRSRFGLLYLSSLFMGIISLITVLPFMAAERPAFYREQAATMYDAGAYALAYGLAEIPYIIVSSGCFVIVFYFLLGFSTQAGKFFWYWLFYALFTGMMTFFGQFLAVATPNLQTAQIISGMLNSIFNVFSGFLITPGNIPTYWIFLYWITPTHYAFEGQVATQYAGDHTEITNSLTGTKETAESYVAYFFQNDFTYAHRFYDFGVLLMFIGLFRFGTFLSLKYIRHEKR